MLGRCQPERHAEVDLHLRQTRSPAHALGNGFRHSRHFLVLVLLLRSDALRVSMSACIVMCRYAAFPLLQAERRSAKHFHRLVGSAGSSAGVRRTPPYRLDAYMGADASIIKLDAS